MADATNRWGQAAIGEVIISTMRRATTRYLWKGEYMEGNGLVGRITRNWLAIGFCVCSCIASQSQAQSSLTAGTASPAIPAAMQALGALVDEALAKNKARVPDFDIY